MSTLGFDDPLLHQARAQARAGAWADVAELLAAHAPVDPARPERLMLHTEALIRSGNPHRARARLREAVPRLEAGGTRQAHRTALNLLGAASFAVGALDDAQAAWDRALELAQEDGDTLLLARATNNLGAVANLRGHRHDALYLYHLAVPVYQRLGEHRGLAETFHNIAMTYREMDALTEADEYEARTMEFARAAAAPRLDVMAQVGRAEVALRRGDHHLARAAALRAADGAAALGDTDTRADALRCAGLACLMLDRATDARQHLDDALRYATATENALMIAESRLAIARVALHTGELATAAREAAAAATTFERLKAARLHAEAQQVLAAVRARAT